MKEELIMSDIYEKEEFEIVCEECSKPFTSEDSHSTLCPDCWNKIVLGDMKEEGKNIG